MAYQTFDGLQKLYGPKRLADATPNVASEALGLYWTNCLLAAQGVVDSYLRRAGYTVPLDFDSLDTEEALIQRALLAQWTGIIALETGAPAVVSSPKGVEGAASKVRTALRDLVQGRLRLPFSLGARKILASVPDTFQTGETWSAPPTMDDRLFLRMRSNWME